MRKTLDQIGHETGTDKRSGGCHNYLKYYEMFLAPLRDKPITLLEQGIWHGDSLRMWKEYFPDGFIVGLDYEDMSQYQEDRIRTVHGTQNDVSFLNKAFSEYSFDVIADDAGHRGDDQIIAFTTLFPYLKSGGLYFIEDLLCSYHHWADKGSFIEYIKNKLVDAVQMNGVIPHDKLCSDKAEQVKIYDGDYFEKNIEWIFVSMGLCIVKKL